MTRQKTFKRRVRARMAKTGESYTAARRMLIANGDRPDVVNREFEPRVSEDKVRQETGRGYQEWFGLLDEWGGTTHSHAEIARRLMDEHAVPGWYAQTVTVAYEQARGLREPGQKADGFEITASKTIAVPVERLFEAFVDESLRERWLPGAELRLRTAKEPRTARFDWEDGSTRVIVGFEAIDETKSKVDLAHARLPDSDTADEMKTWWRERVAALKPLLERGEFDA
jgi:Domain of unknown function (DUF4287)